MWSLPVRGAWVEIRDGHRMQELVGKSLPVRGAWVEILLSGISNELITSLPVRGAWVEIQSLGIIGIAYDVAPRAGSVG